MNFICSQKNLYNAVSTVQKAISTRTTIPILEGIFIKASNDSLELVGTNLDLGIEVNIEATIIEEGAIVLPSKIFGDLIRKLPDAEIRISILDKQRVKIQCLNSTTVLQGLSPEEYPSLQKIDDIHSIEIPQDLLKNIIQQTIFAAATDETRPIFTGALFEIEEDSLYVVCLDGFRVAIRKGQVSVPTEIQKIVIPGKSLGEIAKILNEDEETVKITISERHVLFDLDNIRIISRLLEGDFLNYRQIMPQEYFTRVKIDAEILYQSIERASLLATESFNKLIRFSIRDDKLVITSNSEIGEAYEEIPIILEGKEIDIAFNARYIIDILRVVDDQEICMDFTTNISPCIIRPLEGSHYNYLLLPVRSFQ